jgi:uncharacterized protein (DUF4415 family)
MTNLGKTDWVRLKKMSDEDIDYSDIPETDNNFWNDAKIIIPHKKVAVKLELDEDIVDWIHNLGDKSNVVLNNLLRSYYLSFKHLKNEFH